MNIQDQEKIAKGLAKNLAVGLDVSGKSISLSEMALAARELGQDYITEQQHHQILARRQLRESTYRVSYL